MMTFIAAVLRWSYEDLTEDRRDEMRAVLRDLRGNGEGEVSKGSSCGPWCDAHEKQGADRERRRIRRAQLGSLIALRTKVRMPFQQDPESFEAFLRAVRDLDAATRAPRNKRK